jgi:hypothetical protein
MCSLLPALLGTRTRFELLLRLWRKSENVNALPFPIEPQLSSILHFQARIGVRFLQFFGGRGCNLCSLLPRVLTAHVFTKSVPETWQPVFCNALHVRLPHVLSLAEPTWDCHSMRTFCLTAWVYEPVAREEPG